MWVDGVPMCELCSAEHLFADKKPIGNRTDLLRCIDCGEETVCLESGGMACRFCDNLKPVDELRGLWSPA